jgi:hypothetical protein
MGSHPDLDPEVFAHLLARIDALDARVNSDYFKPEPNSTLDLDDAAVHPMHFSVAPRWCLMSAIDHVRTIGQLIRSTTMPMVSTASLLRSAIETGSAAIHFLAPDSRVERIRRFFDEERAQISEASTVVGLFGGELDGQRATSFLKAAVDNYPAAGPYESLRTRISTVRRIADAEAEVERVMQRGRTPGILEGWWRLLSGITHGRRYAWQLALSVVEKGYDEATDVVDADVAFDSPRIVSGLRVALDVIETGVHIYGTRARKFTRLPEDAELLAQLIASGVRERE